MLHRAALLAFYLFNKKKKKVSKKKKKYLIAQAKHLRMQKLVNTFFFLSLAYMYIQLI